MHDMFTIVIKNHWLYNNWDLPGLGQDLTQDCSSLCQDAAKT